MGVRVTTPSIQPTHRLDPVAGDCLKPVRNRVLLVVFQREGNVNLLTPIDRVNHSVNAIGHGRLRDAKYDGNTAHLAACKEANCHSEASRRIDWPVRRTINISWLPFLWIDRNAEYDIRNKR